MILLALLTVALFLISVRASQRLRWQLHMRARLEESLKLGHISLRTAKEIISHPKAYGIARSQLDFDSFSRSKEKSWVERKAAQRGWNNISTLLIVAALAGVGLSVAMLLGFLIQNWDQAIFFVALKVFAVIVSTLLLSALLVLLWAKLVYPFIQMLRY